MKRPKRRGARYPNKPKFLDKTSPAERLEAAAVKVIYTPSDYHCPLANGRPPKGRAKPAMHCPREWTVGQALIALRTAIRARLVSRQWHEDFPRHVWHREGDVWYEACTNVGTIGTYHAYPIEEAGLPPDLRA
jgi:hypothetical protein